MAPLDRRRFLSGAALLGIGAVAGCSVNDPRVLGGAETPPPVPTPTPVPPFPGAADGRRAEQHLAALAAVIRDGEWKPGGVRTHVLATLVDLHTDHATTLAAADPTRRPTSSPTPTEDSPAPDSGPDPRAAAEEELAGLDLSEALAVVTGAADTAVRSYREAVTATSGGTALLWGSLAVTARQAKLALSLRATPPGTPPVTDRSPLDEQTDVDALRSTISQAHAIVFGYQVAIAEFGFDSGERERADAALTAHRRTRDTMTAWLSERNVVPPAATSTYDLPIDVTSAATAGELIMTMELAYQPFLGGVLAAVATTAEKGTALAALEASSEASLRWGGPLVRWPGWPD